MITVEMPKLRSLVAETFIAAPSAAVWHALTEPEELVHWFSLEARVTAGVGGRFWLSWGEPITSDSVIEIWEPDSHLRVAELRPLGIKIQPQAGSLIQRTVDYSIEARP